MQLPGAAYRSAQQSGTWRAGALWVTPCCKKEVDPVEEFRRLTGVSLYNMGEANKGNGRGKKGMLAEKLSAAHSYRLSVGTGGDGISSVCFWLSPAHCHP